MNLFYFILCDYIYSYITLYPTNVPSFIWQLKGKGQSLIKSFASKSISWKIRIGWSLAIDTLLFWFSLSSPQVVELAMLYSRLSYFSHHYGYIYDRNSFKEEAFIFAYDSIAHQGGESWGRFMSVSIVLISYEKAPTKK